MCANVIQAKTFQLQAPIGSTDTTIAVKNLETIYGDDVEMSGSIQYATLEPESQSNQEIISFTGITLVSANIWNLTGVTRGLDAQPTNGIYGNDPAQGKAHASSVDCILSDSPQVWDDKASKSEDEEVTGAWTFDISPIVPTPDSTFEAANKDYVDNSVAAGASDSTTTTIGISRQSYSPTVTIGTATMTIASPCVVTFTSHGLTLNDSIQFTTTGALPTGLLPSTTYYVISAGLTANTFQLATTRGGTAINTTGSQSGTHTLYKTTPIVWNKNDPAVMTQTKYQAGAELYGTDAGGDDTYVVTLSPVLSAYTTGMVLRAKMTTANTGACTIDFGPGVKSVKLQDGTDPLDGMVGTGIHEYIYDGTNLVLQNPVQVIESANNIGKFMTLNENMTAGDVAWVDSDGKINTWDGYTSAASSLGATITVYASCLVDTNTIVIVYNRASNTYMKAGTISGETITWGAETASIGGNNQAGVCKVDTNAGCAFSSSGSTFSGYPFTVSGTTITLGTPTTINSVSTTVVNAAISICQVDTNKVCFAYQAKTNTPQSRIGTISANVLTVGTEVDIGGNTADQIYVVKMSTSKVGFMSKDSGLTTMRMNAATISNSTLTMGTAQSMTAGAGTLQWISLIYVTTDILVAFYSTTAPNLYSRYLTVSGTTVTAQTEQSLVSGGNLSANYQNSALLINNNTIAVASGGANYTVSFCQVNNSDYILNVLDTVPYYSTITPHLGKCLYSTNKFIGFNTTNSYFGNNNARYIVGILQSTGTAGQTKKVTTTGGVSSVHSSLQIGEPYYTQVSGGVGLQSLLYANASTYDGIAKIGTAISSTEILVNIA